MRLLLATDAWHPQVNGVVRSVERMAEAAAGLGVEPLMLTPADFASLPMPGYSEIRLSLVTRGRVLARWKRLAPSHVHIATEGPIGHFARWYCLTNHRPFTTSFHTRFTDYAAARFPVPEGWTWAWLRWFHNAGRGTMVSTASLAQELRMQGFRTVLRWPRGDHAACRRDGSAPGHRQKRGRSQSSGGSSKGCRKARMRRDHEGRAELDRAPLR